MKSNISCTDTTKTPRCDDFQTGLYNAACAEAAGMGGYDMPPEEAFTHAMALARKLEEELIALRQLTDAHFRLCKGENNL